MKELIIKVDEEKMDIEGNAPVVDRPQELVRCKDCKHGEDWGVLIACGKARGFGLTHDKNWFCADGERKQNEKS